MIELHVASAVLATMLLAVAWIDIRTLRIPDLLNLAIGAAGLTATWLLERDLAAALLGAALGYATLAGANLAYRALRGRDGIGMGDAKFLGGAGAWIGWQGLPFTLLIASATGIALIAAARLAGRRITNTTQTPFGPFLAAAAMLVWLVQAYG